MTTHDAFLTEDGRKRAISLLEYLRTVRRGEVAQYLHNAKKSGNVVDNVAYEEAMNEEARLEGRIQELEQLLAMARPISKVSSDAVSLGSVVFVRTEEGREYAYTIVGAFEAKPSAGLISNESPVGKALLGHKPGDVVTISTQGGVREFTIITVDGVSAPISFKRNYPEQGLSEAKQPREKTEAATAVQDSTLTIRVMEDPLTAQNLTMILSALNELHTKCWLIYQGRLADLIEYTQTHDARFTKEANLVVSKLTHNSPAEIKLDVGIKDVAEALEVAIDGIAQAPLRHEEAKLQNKAIALDMRLKELDAQSSHADREQARRLEAEKAELEKQKSLLDIEKQRLELEKQRLEIQEKRLGIEIKRVDYALEIAGKMISILRPNAGQETKELLMRVLLPDLLQLGNGKGLQVELLPPQEGTKPL